MLLKLSIAILAILPTASAFAADIVTLPPPPVVSLRPSNYDWTGAYAGIWLGTACINGTLTDNGTGLNYLNAGCGYKGGGLVGYNIQFDRFVWGAEADLGTTTNIVTNNDITANYSMKLDALGTIRARAGWAMDDTLLYLTGGAAYARGDINGVAPAVGPSNLVGDEWGFQVGGGIEHAITDKFRVRVEYAYTHMFDSTYTNCTASCNITIHWGDEHEAKIAAIWAF